MNWYLHVIKNNYVNFSGRASRPEFWFFILFNLIATVVIGAVSGIIRMPFLGGLYSLAVLLPSLGVTVRRLQDTDRPWPWIFISLIPIAGPIILIVLLAQEGTDGENQFGEDPKLFGPVTQY